MKNIFVLTKLLIVMACVVKAQTIKTAAVPEAVKLILEKRYPQAKKVIWEKENGNFEANWGGKSGEDMSVQFTPQGKFVEQVEAIKVNALPANIISYIHQHYQSIKITESGKVTNAKGQHFFEAEVKGKDLVFDEKGNFVKKD